MNVRNMGWHGWHEMRVAGWGAALCLAGACGCEPVDHTVGEATLPAQPDGSSDAASITASTVSGVGGGTTGGGAGSAGEAEGERVTRPVVPDCPGVLLGDMAPTLDNACAGTSYESELLLYDTVFVVDASSLMQEPVTPGGPSRWQAVSEGIQEAVRGLGLSNVGFVFFDESGCVAPSEPLAVSPAYTLDVPAMFEARLPAGTRRPALRALEYALTAFEPPQPFRGPGSVVLIAAGALDSCSGDDPVGEVVEVVEQAWEERAVATHVIELGTGFDLNPVAAAGGTDAVFSITQGNLGANIAFALRDVFRGPLVLNDLRACKVTIAHSNTGERIDPSSAISFLAGPDGAELIPRVGGASDCTGPQGGWFATGTDPLELELCGCSCARIGRATKLQVEVACLP